MAKSIKVWSGSTWEDVGVALPAVTSQFIQLTNPSATGYTIRAAASQSANIFQIQNNAVSPLFTIDALGNIIAPNFSTATGYLQLDNTTVNGYSPTIVATRSSNDTSVYYNSARIVIQNKSTTANNYSNIGFLSANGNDTAAIWAQNILHTTGAATGHLIFGTNNAAGAASERMRIDNVGNVGLNNASPTYQFDVYKSSNAANYVAARLLSDASATGLSKTSLRMEKATGYGGEIAGYINQGVGSGLAFSTVNGGTTSEWMYLNNNGQLGLGNSNPAYSVDVSLTNTSTTVGTTAQYMRFINTTGNQDNLQVYSIRTVAGSASWGTQDWVIRRFVDATAMSEIRWAAGEYNPITVLLDPTGRGIRTAYVGTSAPSSGTGNNGDTFLVYV